MPHSAGSLEAMLGPDREPDLSAIGGGAPWSAEILSSTPAFDPPVGTGSPLLRPHQNPLLRWAIKVYRMSLIWVVASFARK